MKELSIQRSGLTDPESIVAIGRATNAQYVLAGTISKLGSMNLFDVKILEAETGGLVDGGGDHRRYTDLSDGIALMGELANAVTGVVPARPPAPEPPYVPPAPRSTRNWFSRHDSNRPSLGINWGPMLTSGNGENEEGYRLGLDIAIVNMNAALPLVGKLFVEGGIDLGFGGEIYGRHNYEYDITKVKYFAYRPYGRLNIGIPLLEDDGFLFLLYAGVGFSYMNAAFEYNYSGYDSAGTGTKTKTLEYSGLDLAFGFIMGARHHGGRVGFNLNTISDESYFHVQLIMGYIYRF
jgi:hypothetical protein